MAIGVSPKLRSSVLFITGLGGVIYEVVADHGERPTVLILLGAMMGLPAFLRADEKRRQPEDSDGGTP